MVKNSAEYEISSTNIKSVRAIWRWWWWCVRRVSFGRLCGGFPPLRLLAAPYKPIHPPFLGVRRVKLPFLELPPSKFAFGGGVGSGFRFGWGGGGV